jgi:hypothetical protein
MKPYYLLTPFDVKEVYLECSNFLYCRLPNGGRGALGKNITAVYLLKGDWDITASPERAERHLASIREKGAR